MIRTQNFINKPRLKMLPVAVGEEFLFLKVPGKMIKTIIMKMSVL